MVPMISAAGTMLLQRNLLYTAVTAPAKVSCSSAKAKPLNGPSPTTAPGAATPR
ncbi:hypothetical protein [Streptomyces himalayensis]